MANTFKVKTNGAMPASAGTPLTLYTCGASNGSVVLGLILCNIGQNKSQLLDNGLNTILGFNILV